MRTGACLRMCLLALVIGASACDNNNDHNGGGQTQPDYWPMALGSYWEFGEMFRHEVTRQTMVEGVSALVLAFMNDPDSLVVRKTQNGLTAYSIHKPAGSPDIPPCQEGWNDLEGATEWLDFSAAAGTSWTVQSCEGETEFTVLATDSTVSNTTYGDFESCIVYRMQRTEGATEWALAPNVGPVAWWFGGEKVELTAYEVLGEGSGALPPTAPQ